MRWVGGKAAARAAARPRVLLIADMCNPAWVSTPLGGWFAWQALSEIVDGHLVTQVRNRADLLAAGVPEERLTTIDSHRLERGLDGVWDLLRGGGRRDSAWTVRTALGVISYGFFERLVWRQFGGRLRAGEFDVVHRLTPVSPAIPSPIAARCASVGVPFVIGPLNGGLRWPPGFHDIPLREKEWLTWLRPVHRALPGYRSTRRHASAIVVGSRVALGELPAWARGRAVYVPGNGVAPDRFAPAVDVPAAPPLRIAFVGRFTRLKGVDMLLEAAAPLVRGGRARVELIGDGPAMAELRAQVAREGIGDGVEFAGFVEHGQLRHRLGRSHVFAFPSIREYGGAVVLEAMALGLVPVVVDYGGPPELVSPRTGFTVPMGPRPQIVAGLRGAFERLAADPTSLPAIGRRAAERVRTQFTWAAKARQLREVYRWVLGGRDRPDFGMPLADDPPAPARIEGGGTG